MLDRKPKYFELNWQTHTEHLIPGDRVKVTTYDGFIPKWMVFGGTSECGLASAYIKKHLFIDIPKHYRRKDTPFFHVFEICAKDITEHLSDHYSSDVHILLGLYHDSRVVKPRYPEYNSIKDVVDVLN